MSILFLALRCKMYHHSFPSVMPIPVSPDLSALLKVLQKPKVSISEHSSGGKYKYSPHQKFIAHPKKFLCSQNSQQNLSLYFQVRTNYLMTARKESVFAKLMAQNVSVFFNRKTRVFNSLMQPINF